MMKVNFQKKTMRRWAWVLVLILCISVVAPSSLSFVKASDSSGVKAHNFTTDGTVSSFFTIVGNLSTGKGSSSYNGLTLTRCLKMESSTSIQFTAPSDGKLTLVFGGTTDAAGKTVKLNGVRASETAGADQMLTLTVAKGQNTVGKGDSINLFYMVYIPDFAGGEPTEAPTGPVTEPTTPQSTTEETVTQEPTQPVPMEGKVEVLESAGWLESAYAEWKPVTGADSYDVYVKKADAADSTYTKIDRELVRRYKAADGAFYYRADAVGLAAGTYTMKIVPVAGKTAHQDKAGVAEGIAVAAHDRTGFAWVEGEANGAYHADGTLKNNAVVLYLTENTKNTVSMDVVTSASGAATTATGIQGILNLYKKGYETRPLCIRMIGQVTDFAVMDGGDMLIGGSGDTKRLSCGVTLEGIGEDATAYGWGIRVKNVSNVEIRNIGVMLCDSNEGDNVGLQQSDDHVWVHNCDFFYGEAGGDADQAKGDGALDCKKSTYVTFSYNHFYDNGKCNLLGLSEGTTDGLYITYHHNWYDHSDSRHPRVRYYSAHVYNNYYDGNAKYGIGACLGSSIFAEGNYFRNCKYPMMTSMQGSDVIADWDTLTRDEQNLATFSKEDGGTIKAFNNYIIGGNSYVTYQQNTTEFDAYEVSEAAEKVPSTVTSYKGSNTYNNFDTADSMYAYTADSPEQAKANVEKYAGRVNGGDCQWAFTEEDDASYALNTGLREALRTYKTALVSEAQGGEEETTQPGTEPTQPSTEPTQPEDKPTPPDTETGDYDKTSAVFSGAYTALNGISDERFVKKVYAAPGGTPNGVGTKDSPLDLETAVTKVENGTAILLLEGTYVFDHQVTIPVGNNGTQDCYNVLKAAKNAKVTLDFSTQPYGDTATNGRGIQLEGDYWYIGGLTVYGAADNGIFVAGSHNVIEHCVLQANRDTGLQISRRASSLSDIKDWPSDNYIINCTSFDNCDPATGENADGFAAKLTCGEGNVFDGCIAYCNCDDGWDLYAKEATGSIGVVTLRNCIAFSNGTLTNGNAEANGDMNGFKLGGSNGKVPTAHTVFNCLAFNNGKDGFTDNGNGGALTLLNCTSYNNAKTNFNFYRTTAGGTFFHLISASGVGTDKFIGRISNSITVNSAKYYQVPFSLTGIEITSGQKVGTVVSNPYTSGAFVSTTAPKITDGIDTVMRNDNGTVTTNGYLMTMGSYDGMGAKYNVANQVFTVKANLTANPETPKSGVVIDEKGGIHYYVDGVKDSQYTGMGTDQKTGEKYWFDNGVAARHKEAYDPASNAWYWFDADGTMATDKDVNIPDGTEYGKWVRYDKNGTMIKGADYRYGGWYYFDEITGAMVHGAYIDADGTPCFYDEVTGVAVDCEWRTIDGNEYWYEAGKRQGLEGRGKEIYDPKSDAWYWLDSIDGGKKAVSKDVYQESSGGKWVRYDAEGHMVKGWNELNGARYYFDLITGAMAKGTVGIDGVNYLFDSTTGALQ